MVWAHDKDSNTGEHVDRGNHTSKTKILVKINDAT